MGNCCCCLNSSDSLERLDSSDSDDIRISSTRTTRSNSTRNNSGSGGATTRRSRRAQASGADTQNIRTVIVSHHEGQQRANTELFRPTSSPMTPQVKDDQMKLAQRHGIISQIPTGLYDVTSKKHTECAICMIDFEVGDEVKYLPCMHVYHKDCIDDWLMRSLKCPACMEPVDAALLSTFDSYSQ